MFVCFNEITRRRLGEFLGGRKLDQIIFFNLSSKI